MVVFQKKKHLRSNLWLEALKNRLTDAKWLTDWLLNCSSVSRSTGHDSVSRAVEQARK
jgi:hypothetical protein